MKINDVIKKAIDIHFHVGPEIIPRKYMVSQLIESEAGKIGGLVLKNHFSPTSPFIAEVKANNKMKLFGGIVLNNSVGGLNPEAVLTASQMSKLPIMVWFPTINARSFLEKSEYEIAPEWVNKKGFIARYAKDVQPVEVFVNGKLTRNAVRVLKMIKDCNATLATGHLSWKEAKILAEQALKMGIRTVITHPIYQRINMPIKIQKELAEKGCFMEQSYSMYSIDKISIEKIAKQIRIVGVDSVILSSDMGQTFSPSPSIALRKFGQLLIRQDFTIDELYKMLVENPRRLLGIDS